MTVWVVVGAQWGDEGKGKITDLLASRSDLVVRYQGGNNAGHTVSFENEVFKLHLLPSGVLHPHVMNVLSHGVVIDPRGLVEEIEEISRRVGRPRLVVSDRAHIVLPLHRDLDRLREEGSGSIGTTRRGIGPAYSDKAARRGIRVGDLFDPSLLRSKVHALVKEWEPLLSRNGRSPLNPESILADLEECARKMEPWVADTLPLLLDSVERGKEILLEGAQGTLLDLDLGTYPFVTSSSTFSGGASTGTGIPPSKIDEVVGVVKAYSTRVGLGPFPTEIPYETREGRMITERGNEYGTTTGRRRRVGWLDLPLLNLSARVNGFTGIALTKLDVLSELPSVHVAEAYEIDGRRVDFPPSLARELQRVKPILVEVPSWRPLRPGELREAKGKGLEELPAPLREYVGIVEKAARAPVIAASVGPRREETLLSPKFVPSTPPKG